MLLDQAPLHKAFWHYTLPSLAALLVSGTYQIIDGIFIGHYIGADGLAGINLAWPLIGVLLAVGMMIGIGCGAQASLSLGAKEPDTARAFLGMGIILPVLFGLPIGWLLFYQIENFLLFQGASGAAAGHSQDYLIWMTLAAPVVLASIIFPFLVRNIGAPRLATLAILVGACSNILLDALFIAWLGWGLMGAAVATLLGESLSIGICIFVLLRQKQPHKLKLTDFRPRLFTLHRVTSTGFSSMVMYLYISFSVVLHNILLIRYGSSLEVAAYSIAGYLMAFYYLTAEGIAGGMQPLVSYYYGAGKIRQVKATFYLAIKIGVGGGLLFTVSLLIWPGFFAGIFNQQDSELLEITRWAIRLHLFALFLDGFLVLVSCWFQALGKGRPATLVSMGNLLIQLPFLAVLPTLLGQSGVWLAVPLSNICLSAFAIYLLWRQFRQLA
ncbi:MDR efflux pump, MATE family [Nitrincola lacisaponensis]|uniref:Multidrug export protein MepA n=1 Tax=Nitrincola lacisaponensis TaxID=267850 RepID=A0A063Y151_9GAMM|nr:MATE family efflux transporter [Nitrincola lacisaponensis]KDE39414.1 MDR efflux pump, MATE family [Nitrincola lacisaponensis]